MATGQGRASRLHAAAGDPADAYFPAGFGMPPLKEAEATHGSGASAQASSKPEVTKKGITLRGLRCLWTRIRAEFADGRFSKDIEIRESALKPWTLQGVESLEQLTTTHLVYM